MLFHLQFFSHHIFHFCYSFYHIHILPTHQGKCYLCIHRLFLCIFFHCCYHLYHLLLLLFCQGKFHLGIQPLFSHQYFHCCYFLITYIFIHLIRGSVIYAFRLFFPFFYSCHFFNHTHHPPSCQGKCHLGIQVLFPLRYFQSCHFFITYTCLNLVRGSVI